MMNVYSQKIVLFISHIKDAVKRILSQEVGLKVTGQRFFNRAENFSYPIAVAIFNDRAQLGYFDSDFYEMGFNEKLMRVPERQLLNVIRHELAHYVLYIEYGFPIKPHGHAFKVLCERCGWGEEVYRASMLLDPENEEGLRSENESVLRKIQKLMALSTSSSRHEAEQALIKSQQLLLKHNIDAEQASQGDEEKFYLKRVMKQKKTSAKMRSIAQILRTFFVTAVFNRSSEYTWLEVVGKRANVEIAEYVTAFLDGEMDKLWHQASRHHFRLSGIAAKNSFFLGLARGYCQKIQALKKEYSGQVANALMVIESKLDQAEKMAYKRLGSSRSQGGYCAESSAIGEMMGKQLQINPALNSTSKRSNELIGLYTETY